MGAARSIIKNDSRVTLINRDVSSLQLRRLRRRSKSLKKKEIESKRKLSYSTLGDLMTLSPSTSKKIPQVHHSIFSYWILFVLLLSVLFSLLYWGFLNMCSFSVMLTRWDAGHLSFDGRLQHRQFPTISDGAIPSGMWNKRELSTRQQHSVRSKGYISSLFCLFLSIAWGELVHSIRTTTSLTPTSSLRQKVEQLGQIKTKKRALYLFFERQT